MAWSLFKLRTKYTELEMICFEVELEYLRYLRLQQEKEEFERRGLDGAKALKERYVENLTYVYRFLKGNALEYYEKRYNELKSQLENLGKMITLISYFSTEDQERLERKIARHKQVALQKIQRGKQDWLKTNTTYKRSKRK